MNARFLKTLAWNAGTLILVMVVSLGGCSKNDNPSQPPNNQPATCNFSTDVVAVNGTEHAVVKVNQNTVPSYIAEFLIDTSAAPTGVALVFSGSAVPDTGTYAIEANPGSLAAGKVYVEYYDAANAWHGTTGSIHVAAGAGGRVYTFCSL